MTGSPAPVAEPPADQTASPAPAHALRESDRDVSPTEPRREAPAAPGVSAITHAIDQVTQVIEEMKRALGEMEEVLETLELAERQKIDDEREIESLQRALRQLHRPAHGGGSPRH